jgi:hypothetical protein
VTELTKLVLGICCSFKKLGQYDFVHSECILDCECKAMQGTNVNCMGIFQTLVSVIVPACIFPLKDNLALPKKIMRSSPKEPLVTNSWNHLQYCSLVSHSGGNSYVPVILHGHSFKGGGGSPPRWFCQLAHSFSGGFHLSIQFPFI